MKFDNIIKYLLPVLLLTSCKTMSEKEDFLIGKGREESPIKIRRGNFFVQAIFGPAIIMSEILEYFEFIDLNKNSSKKEIIKETRRAINFKVGGGWTISNKLNDGEIYYSGLYFIAMNEVKKGNFDYYKSIKEQLKEKYEGIAPFYTLTNGPFFFDERYKVPPEDLEKDVLEGLRIKALREEEKSFLSRLITSPPIGNEIREKVIKDLEEYIKKEEAKLQP